MNRAQRREAKRDKRRERTCLIPPDIAHKLPTGTRFTIAGLRLTEQGALITDCPPGAETVFTAETEQLIANFDRAAEFLDAQKVESRGRMLWDGTKMHGGRA